MIFYYVNSVMHWTIELKDKIRVKYQGDISDVISDYKDNVERLVLSNNDNFACKEKIDPSILLFVHKYDKKIVEHFHYLDEIHIGMVTCCDDISSLPNTATIYILTIQDRIIPVNCKIRNIRFSYYSLRHSLPDIEPKLKVDSCSTENVRIDEIQYVLDQFESIGTLHIHGEKLVTLDADKFSQVNIENLYIHDNGFRNDISMILKNQYIKHLKLDCGTYILNGSNESLVEISYINNAILFSKTEIEKCVKKNNKNVYNMRFARVKPILASSE